MADPAVKKDINIDGSDDGVVGSKSGPTASRPLPTLHHLASWKHLHIPHPGHPGPDDIDSVLKLLARRLLDAIVGSRFTFLSGWYQLGHRYGGHDHRNAFLSGIASSCPREKLASSI